jgi:hypothetical protein
MSLVLDIVMLVRSASLSGKCLTSRVGVNEWERIRVRALANNIEQRGFRSFVHLCNAVAIVMQITDIIHCITSTIYTLPSLVITNISLLTRRAL